MSLKLSLSTGKVLRVNPDSQYDTWASISVNIHFFQAFISVVFFPVYCYFKNYLLQLIIIIVCVRVVGNRVLWLLVLAFALVTSEQLVP